MGRVAPPRGVLAVVFCVYSVFFSCHSFLIAGAVGAGDNRLIVAGDLSAAYYRAYRRIERGTDKSPTFWQTKGASPLYPDPSQPQAIRLHKTALLCKICYPFSDYSFRLIYSIISRKTVQFYHFCIQFHYIRIQKQPEIMRDRNSCITSSIFRSRVLSRRNTSVLSL